MNESTRRNLNGFQFQVVSHEVSYYVHLLFWYKILLGSYFILSKTFAYSIKVRKMFAFENITFNFLIRYSRDPPVCMYSRNVLKGTVASVWVWLKVVWLDRKLSVEEPLIFYIFLLSLWFLILINRNALLWGKCKGNAQIMQSLTGKCVKKLVETVWEVSKEYWRTLWEMPKKYWRSFQQPLPSSRYTLRNAQIEVETHWAHFPACLQPNGSKDTPLAYRWRVSAYIRHVLLISKKNGGFIKLN